MCPCMIDYCCKPIRSYKCSFLGSSRLAKVSEKSSGSSGRRCNHIHRLPAESQCGGKCMNDHPNFVSKKHKHNNFYEVYTTISWRNFMCLRCVHGPACGLRLLSPSCLDILIDLDQLMGRCSMYYKRYYKTERMRWHERNINHNWYYTGILRIKRSRAMLAAKKSAFENIFLTGGDK